jgi:pimeloyl-ACP methyl ester carboxylesterase
MFGSPLRYRVEAHAPADGAEILELVTDAGSIPCRLHAAPEGNAGIVWVFGAGGGWGGPAGGIYERLARVLQPEGITSLQVAYRQPAHMQPCVEDTLTGAAFLASRGSHRVALVGHSFGGAVVINAGAVGGTSSRWRR